MFRKILQYRTISALSLGAMLFVLGGFSWAYLHLRTIGNGPFILHFNDIDGITRVGGLGNVLGMGILGAIIVAIDFFIAISLEERDPFLGRTVAVATFIFGVLLFVGFAAILNVN